MGHNEKLTKQECRAVIKNAHVHSEWLSVPSPETRLGPTSAGCKSGVIDRVSGHHKLVTR